MPICHYCHKPIEDMPVLDHGRYSHQTCWAKRVIRQSVIVLALIFMGVSVNAELRPISVSVDKNVCMAPCKVAITVTVPYHKDNRKVALVYGYEDPSEWDYIEVQTVRHVTLTEAGEYRIYAVLLRQDDISNKETFQDSKVVIVE